MIKRIALKSLAYLTLACLIAVGLAIVALVLLVFWSMLVTGGWAPFIGIGCVIAVVVVAANWADILGWALGTIHDA